MSLDGIDIIFELAALVELDEVSNLNQAIQFWLTAQGISGNVILDMGPINCIKGTLIQIWKFPYTFVYIKTIPCKFHILNSTNSWVIYARSL